jgi:hypothetical protein
MPDYSNYFQRPTAPNRRVVDMGKLYVPSGRIYCCDPFLSDEVNPLEKTVPTGHFDVKLFLVTLPDWGTRIALASLIVSEHKPICWHEATYMINKGRLSKFRVDAGLACFLDKETRELFVRVVDDFYKKNPEGNYYDDILAAEFTQNAEPGNPRTCGDWDLHYPAKGNPRNIAMFASGLGDGSYASYWGLDAADQPAMLVADFELLP